MDIGKIIEGTIQDLSWLEEPMTYDIEKHYKKNDVINELELQWGGGRGEIIDDLEEGVDDLEEGVDGLIANETEKDIVKHARKIIASGKSGKDAIRLLKSKFGSKSVESSVNELRSAFEMDGVAGCFAVDCSGFSSCREAMDHAQKSPFKRFLSFVINHDPEKGCHKTAKTRTSSCGGSIDVLLGGGSDVKGSQCFCREIGLPVLSSDGISPENVNKTVIDLMSLGGLDEKEAKEIEVMASKSPFEAMRKAFRLASKKLVRDVKSDYSEKVDVSEHKIDRASLDVELSKEIVTPPQEVDPVDHDGDREVELFEESKESSLDVDAKPAMPDFDIESACSYIEDVVLSNDVFGNDLGLSEGVLFEHQDVSRGDGRLTDFDIDKELDFLPQQELESVRARLDEVDVMDLGTIEDVDLALDSLFEVEMSEASDMSLLDIDERGIGTDVEIDDENSDIEVDPSVFVDEAFEGTDIISFDSEKETVAPLEIDGSSDFTF